MFFFWICWRWSIWPSCLNDQIPTDCQTVYPSDTHKQTHQSDNNNNSDGDGDDDDDLPSKLNLPPPRGSTSSVRLSNEEEEMKQEKRTKSVALCDFYAIGPHSGHFQGCTMHFLRSEPMGIENSRITKVLVCLSPFRNWYLLWSPF